MSQEDDIFHGSSQPGLVFDPGSLQFLAVNEAAARLYRFSREELLLRTFRDLFCATDWEIYVEKKLQGLSEEIERTGPWHHVKRDGTTLFVEITLEPYRMQTRPAVYAIVNDISTRLDAQQALVSTEQRYREIFENANDIIYTHDLKGNFTSINKAAERAAGYSRHEAIGLNIARIIAPEDLTAAQGMIRRKLGGERTTNYELEIIAKDGLRIPLEVSTRLQFEDGKPVAVQGIARDITERKQADRKLLQALKAAQAATVAKSRFLANVSHEIRTPMNGVLGMIHLLLDTNLTNEQRDYAATLLQSATSLLEIMNDILDFSKIEAARLTVENIAFSIEEVLGNIVKLLAGRASAKGLEMRTAMGPDLPQLVTGDPLRLRQILMNLLSNAIKFTESGTIVLEANHLESLESHSIFRFAVIDTGVGVPAHALERIFESFVQADDSSTRLYGGTGLGLAISRQLVELMGGQIGVESEPAKGSKFWFVVPLGNTSVSL